MLHGASRPQYKRTTFHLNHSKCDWQNCFESFLAPKRLWEVLSWWVSYIFFLLLLWQTSLLKCIEKWQSHEISFYRKSIEELILAWTASKCKPCKNGWDIIPMTLVQCIFDLTGLAFWNIAYIVLNNNVKFIPILNVGPLLSWNIQKLAAS